MLDTLTILAPGLLGASIAKAARARATARRITLWARRPEIRDALRTQPFADAIAETPTDAVRDAELVILAAPVEQIITLAAQISPALPRGAIVTDVGSVKTRICRECTAAMPPHATFIGSHPMSGSALTGWQNSTPDLFAGRTVFVTPVARASSPCPESSTGFQPVVLESSTDIPVCAAPPPLQKYDTDKNVCATLQTLTTFWRALGATPVILPPEEHDEIVAHISHLPQAIATTLAALLAQKPPQWRTFAGNGLRDTTRIAASDATMWIEIFQQNRAEILRALDAYQTELAAMRAALATEDWPALRARLEAGKKFRDSL